MKYILEYNGKRVTRNADSAEAAVEKLCDQYGWRCHLKLYDADTRGLEWAECAVDTDGGINWNLTVIATKKDAKAEEELISEQLVELPAPETLQDLTGQESGIVIYPNGEMLVCNWSLLGAHELPKVFAGIEIMGWEDEDDVFADAARKDTSDFRPLLEGRDLIWDANGDLASIENGTYYWGDDFDATVWTLTDGTIVITPERWN